MESTNRTKLPKVERNSFYERYKPQNADLHFNTDRDTSEFATWKVDYTYDRSGNCKATIIKYEDT